MTSRSVTFFKQTLIALVSTACLSKAATAATVSGRILLIDSKVAAVQKHHDFSGVVVWLSPREGSAMAPRLKRVQMLQKDKRFTPHILAIPSGTTVDFPNLDPIFHNAFSNYDGEIFDVALYPPGTSRSVRFKRPGIVRVFCNIHPSMSALIVVLDSDWIAITDSSGRYTFSGVPPGEYALHFLHERAKEDVLNQLTRPVSTKDEDVTVPAMSISEAGYLPITHKNKYGRDYPSDTESDGPYKPLPVQ